MVSRSVALGWAAEQHLPKAPTLTVVTGPALFAVGQTSEAITVCVRGNELTTARELRLADEVVAG